MSKWFRRRRTVSLPRVDPEKVDILRDAPSGLPPALGDLDVVPTGGKTLVLRRKERTMGSLLKVPSGELIKVAESADHIRKADGYVELTAEGGQKVQVNTHQVVWIEDAE